MGNLRIRSWEAMIWRWECIGCRMSVSGDDEAAQGSSGGGLNTWIVGERSLSDDEGAGCGRPQSLYGSVGPDAAAEERSSLGCK